MRGILLHLLTAALYAGVWFACWRSGLQSNSARLPVTFALTAALLCHGLALGTDLFEAHYLHFGLINALSLTMWLAMALYAVESTLTRLDGLLLIASPVAGTAALLPALLGGHPLTVQLAGWAFRLHIIIAMMAYSLFTLAAFHAILMVAVEKSLHSAAPISALRRLPPLLILEQLLFRLIGAAFVLLTITVISGVFFSTDIFGKPFTLSHKSIFSILGWLVFGVLLTGRIFKGWRGKTALRWTISGLILMILAYAGTRFVLEFLLDRSY